MKATEVIKRDIMPVITKEEFFEWLVSNDDVELVAMVEHEDPKDDEIVIRLKRYNPPHGRVLSVHPAETLCHSINEWDDLAAKRRDLHIMTYQTRIVGYYSQLQNWNHSKLAELYDRQRGNYGVKETHNEEETTEVETGE